MLMDVPHFGQVFRSAFRVLVNNGRMIWTIMHPCFQSPYSESVPDEQGLVHYGLIKSYEEQQWKSGGKGTIRGTLGAHHRPLSQYLNAFVENGFRLTHISEPTVPLDSMLERDQRIHQFLPPILGVVGIKS
jgi:hypothetical protein